MLKKCKTINIFEIFASHFIRVLLFPLKYYLRFLWVAREIKGQHGKNPMDEKFQATSVFELVHF